VNAFPREEGGDEVNQGAIPKAVMLWGFFIKGGLQVTMKRITFVIGGARSGKSAFALGRASQLPGPKVYIATAQPLDAEMDERIDKHRKERGSAWETVEEPIHLGQAVEMVSHTYDVALIDCLTLWLSNLLCATMDMERAEAEFLDQCRALDGNIHLFIVANEVGMGIVPENEMARKFRDVAGRMNQRVAAMADEVFLVAAGIPVKIK
jgi:adenosylcobinamide kinase / adenosylcobinamide-phosphate guanylyltransferase